MFFSSGQTDDINDQAMVEAENHEFQVEYLITTCWGIDMTIEYFFLIKIVLHFVSYIKFKSTIVDCIDFNITYLILFKI